MHGRGAPDGGWDVSRICVTGVWHQGTVLAAAFASLGHDVVGLCEPAAAAQLNAGRPLVHEPELPELLASGLAAGRLRFTADAAAALPGADFVFLSTDTPVNQDDSPNLESVYALAEQIRDEIDRDVVLCVTAQVLVTTTEQLASLVSSNGRGHRCEAAYVPEFLRLGEAVRTFFAADRFVVGADDPLIAERVAALFRPLDRPLVLTTVRSAEMAKHAANAFLATSISFINEIADLCGAVGADPGAVVEILKLDRRIGPYAYLSPGLGFAGGTLGRELRALQDIGAAHGVRVALTDAAILVNQARTSLVSLRLREALGDLGGRKVALHGLTYKLGTDTLRRTIALDVIRSLLEADVEVTASDPLVDAGALAVDVIRDPHEAACGSDALVLLNDAAPDTFDLPRLRDVMRGDVILDTRSSLAPDEVRASGLRYGSLWAVDA